MSDNTVPYLENRVADLRRLLYEAERELDEARKKAAPFQPGDVIEARLSGTSWQPVIVREVVASGSSPWYMVSTRKKNGEWGSALRHAFNYVRPLSGASSPEGESAR